MRLELPWLNWLFSRFWVFQFHKGAIRTLIRVIFGHRSTYFNSIKVRLEQIKGSPLTDIGKNFNSIKVRLERFLGSKKPRLTTFQFHKGAIRTYRGSRCYRAVLTFQFHKGAIRTSCAITCGLLDFISIP